MLAQNLYVKFSCAAGQESLQVYCDYVLFGLEFVGNVDEKLDYSLEEKYNHFRELFEIKVKLDATQSDWMMNVFLKANDKVITIDNNGYEVVNNMKQAEFPLFKGNSHFSHPKLKFKKKI